MIIILTIKVIPSAGCARFYRDSTGRLVLCVKSSPEKGKANKELIKNMARALKIPQANIVIMAGALSRYKKIKIYTLLTEQELFTKLECESQSKIF